MNKQERPWFDPISIGCLILMLFLASYSLEDTVWVADLNRVTTLALLGLTIGLMLGQSQFNSRVSFWLGFISSIEFVSWQVIFTGSEKITWIEKANLLFIRIHYALNQLINSQPLQDGVLFFIGMAFLFWFLGLFSGFYLTRYGKPWLSLLIAGIVIFIIQLFQPAIFRNNIFSSVYVFVFLLLMARLKYLSSHVKWEKQNTTEDKDTQSTFNKYAFFLSLIIIIIAWNTPYLMKAVTSGSKEQMELRDRFKGVWTTAENFFAPFKQKPNYQKDFWGNVLTLGAGRSTKEDVLFTVATPGLDIFRKRYYWRERFYDQYQSGFWQNSGYSEQRILANQPININEGTEHKTGIFSIQVFSRQFTFISPQIPLEINQETTLLLLNKSEHPEVISIMPNKILESGEKYELEAAILNPFLEDLLTSRSDYPKWVTDFYLQMPEGISPRIRILSISLTREKDSTYDKIQAITKYLRENYSYADSISDLPLENSDPIEFFLFTKRSGFCTYFASAEVLLLRSIGIPARLVVGYAQGELLMNGNQYQVRDKDNHAWPEVYFDGIGWIAFEPTPSQPTIDYQPAGIFTNFEEPQVQGLKVQQTIQPNTDRLHLNLWERAELANPPAELGPKSSIQSQNLNNWYFLGIALVFFLLFFVLIRRFFQGEPFPVIIETYLLKSGIKPPIWFIRWARYVQLFPIGKIFSQIDFMLIFLDQNLNFTDTPRQKVTRLQKIIPDSIFYLNQLLDEYERELFGPYQADLVVARNSIKEVWKLVFKKWVIDSRSYLKKKIAKLFRY